MKYSKINFNREDVIKYFSVNSSFNFLEIGIFTLAVELFLEYHRARRYGCPYAVSDGQIYPIVDEVELLGFIQSNTPLPLLTIEDMMEIYYSFFEHCLAR